MRTTWARGQHPAPARCPLSYALETEVVSTPGTKLCAKLATRLEQRVTVLEKLIIFCTQTPAGRRVWKGEGSWGCVGFMQSVSSTLNNDFYRCPCRQRRRRRAAMPSGQVYEFFFYHSPSPYFPPLPAHTLLPVLAKLCRLIKLLYSLERENCQLA